ncbi:interleukin-12 subunit beta-like [Conger conger]|uniref:interleukin-12 subunit beta-like n=1 Tax=Conger conger TaxID=82655 RepID=UPI002A5B077C|nr:interleukin-12 subunit beta-like [Conger conger]
MFSFLLVALLLIILPAEGSSGNYRTYTLTPHVIVVEKELQNTVLVPLSCGATEGMEISWRREDGRLLPNGGNNISIPVPMMMGGKFTCHDNAGTLLNHQLVLVQLRNPSQRKILERTGDSDYIQCLSRNYNGDFHCSWKWTQDGSTKREGAVVYISAKRSSGSENITCTVDEDGAGISCLDKFQCQYAEELDFINLRVYLRYKHRVEEYVKDFYISEIVRPDRIAITKVDGETFQMQYPKTWSRPASYFPLTFHIKVLSLVRGRDCTFQPEPQDSHEVQEMETQNETFSVGNRGQFLLCVRAQDQLCNLKSWSEWSHYEMK